MLRFLFFSLWLAFHPVHVSLLSIDYVPERNAFNLFLRLYFDDFLLDAGIKSEDQKNLNFADADTFTKEVIGNYINNKINIHVNERQISPELEDLNLSDNEIRMNMSFNSTDRVKTITVKNLIMTSLYNDQANMTIIRMNDFEEGVKFTPEETEKTFIIN
jgi:hypothetical protein